MVQKIRSRCDNQSQRIKRLSSEIRDFEVTLKSTAQKAEQMSETFEQLLSKAHITRRIDEIKEKWGAGSE